MIRKILLVSILAGLAYAGREQLVRLLTRYTGTWVGTDR